MKWTRKDLVVLAIGAVVFMAYAIWLVQYMPMGMTRLLTTAAILVAIGIVSGAVMSGKLVNKLVLLIAIPVIHIAYEGLDPAKPALSAIAAGLEVVCLWLGAVCGHLSGYLVAKDRSETT